MSPILQLMLCEKYDRLRNAEKYVEIELEFESKVFTERNILNLKRRPSSSGGSPRVFEHHSYSTYVLTYVRTYICRYVHMYAYKCFNYVHTYICTYVYVHIRIHIHSCVSLCNTCILVETICMEYIQMVQYKISHNSK